MQRPARRTNADAIAMRHAAVPPSSRRASRPRRARAPRAPPRHGRSRPGIRYEAWTFGSTRPGPAIHVRQGQRVLGHAHERRRRCRTRWTSTRRASRPNVAFADVMPGESKTFSFVASVPGVFMYHCGTAPAFMHIANGMYGAIVVEPKNMPAADSEYVLVSSEWYLERARPRAPASARHGQGRADDARLGDVERLRRPVQDPPAHRGARARRCASGSSTPGPSLNTEFHVVGTVLSAPGSTRTSSTRRSTRSRRRSSPPAAAASSTSRSTGPASTRSSRTASRASARRGRAAQRRPRRRDDEPLMRHANLNQREQGAAVVALLLVQILRRLRVARLGPDEARTRELPPGSRGRASAGVRRRPGVVSGFPRRRRSPACGGVRLRQSRLPRSSSAPFSSWAVLRAARADQPTRAGGNRRRPARLDWCSTSGLRARERFLVRAWPRAGKLSTRGIDRDTLMVGLKLALFVF